ncbi:hypothetical protein TWF217_009509 [Orbilia oligospora]|nr:hypothetical protein TWF751_003837 [Orbilia oligospora]KAF3231804.1 hypothetical protein TWF128_004492 [Orbilia oligospora]KAF3248063.1 hypothetical protein TWF217_009509 [Orbilia oligospora]KAF3274080.1 hypothetical protein TWF132_003961 [Orbilia oligospora]
MTLWLHAGLPGWQTETNGVINDAETSRDKGMLPCLALQWIFRHGKLGRRGNLTASIDVTSHGGSRYAHRSMHDSDLPAAALPLPQNRETFKAGCLRVIE